MKLYKIDQYFEFTFNTQRFDTGAATDADSTPTYRVYEENSDTVLVSGNCAKRDDSNTTGYYYVRDQCTTANGFEVGKTYEVRIEATVNSVAGAAVVGRFAMIATNTWDSLFGGTAFLDVDVNTIVTDAITAAAVKSDAGNKLADHILRRSQANVEASSNGDTYTGRSLAGAIAKLVNKISVSGSTLTVCKSDDSTTSFTQTVASSGAASPIISMDTD